MILFERVQGGRLYIDAAKIDGIEEDQDNICWLLIGPHRIPMRLSFDQIREMVFPGPIP